MATHLIPVIGKTLFSAPPPNSSPSKASENSRKVAAPNQEKLDRERRLDALRRRRRSVAGTIATSPRGFLVSKELAPSRISLLGE